MFLDQDNLDTINIFVHYNDIFALSTKIVKIIHLFVRIINCFESKVMDYEKILEKNGGAQVRLPGTEKPIEPLKEERRKTREEYHRERKERKEREQSLLEEVKSL